MAWEPTIAEFEEFLGGAHVLRQLTDPNRTGQPNYATAQTYLDAGCAEVRERIEVKHTPETVANLDAVSAHHADHRGRHLRHRVAVLRLQVNAILRGKAGARNSFKPSQPQPHRLARQRVGVQPLV